MIIHNLPHSVWHCYCPFPFLSPSQEKKEVEKREKTVQKVADCVDAINVPYDNSNTLSHIKACVHTHTHTARV